MQEEQKPAEDPKTDDTLSARPPGFKSWNAWYVLVLGTLAVLVAIFYALTVALS